MRVIDLNPLIKLCATSVPMTERLLARMNSRVSDDASNEMMNVRCSMTVLCRGMFCHSAMMTVHYLWRFVMRAIATLVTALSIAFAAVLPVMADEAKPAALPRSAAPADVELYFISPKDGETVGQEFVVQFGLKGMGIAPAGIVKEKTGHHHLLIDADELPPLDQPIPMDAKHVHFGAGQTETVLKLTPGTHTLQLNLADALHLQFDPPIVSKKITITVK
jgi:hypothetical protein